MGDKTDHDFIIEMHTDMKYVRKDVSELKNEFKLQGERLGGLERFRWQIGGALGVLAIGIPILIKVFW